MTKPRTPDNPRSIARNNVDAPTPKPRPAPRKAANDNPQSVARGTARPKRLVSDNPQAIGRGASYRAAAKTLTERKSYDLPNTVTYKRSPLFGGSK
jgi:hypothetical protein